MRKSLLCAVVSIAAAIPVAAQRQGEYLDIFTVRVKPDRLADFNAVAKRIADANRQHKGDNWLATSVLYGENNTFAFISTRANYADIEKAMNTFENALGEALGGRPAVENLFNAFSATTEHSKSQIWRRRWDLSWNAPSDPEAYNKLLGNARFITTMQIQVRPGMGQEYEQHLKQVKSAFEKDAKDRIGLVSQLASGGPAGMYRIATLRESLASMDSGPTLRKLMGDEAYDRWSRETRDIVLGSETTISRIVPDLSNMAPEVVAVAPQFWTPKTETAMAAAKAPKRKKKPLTDENK